VLRRDASKIADALMVQDVERTADGLSGWLIHEEILAPSQPKSRKRPEGELIPFSDEPLRGHARPRKRRWQLTENSADYLDDAPFDYPNDTEMDQLEQYLAEFAVKNQLDANLFKNNDT
jgi:hypothetical protein